MSKIEIAVAFCVAGHQACGQKRKFSGGKYFEHPIEVSKLVVLFDGSEDMICAALLHDLVEDTQIPLTSILTTFGKPVADMAAGLTKVSKLEDGDRAVRKAIDLEHTAVQSPDTKTIKLCDVISNMSDIHDGEVEWAKKYVLEKELLLEVLKEGDIRAWNLANGMVKAAKFVLFGDDE